MKTDHDLPFGQIPDGALAEGPTKYVYAEADLDEQVKLWYHDPEGPLDESPEFVIKVFNREGTGILVDEIFDEFTLPRVRSRTVTEETAMQLLRDYADGKWRYVE